MAINYKPCNSEMHYENNNAYLPEDSIHHRALDNLTKNQKYGVSQNQKYMSIYFTKLILAIYLKSNEFNITTHHLFIDFKAAYDTITRNKTY
jgi:hypothetical protein